VESRVSSDAELGAGFGALSLLAIYVELTFKSTSAYPADSERWILARSFGAELRERRRAKGVSQRELAERAGVDFSYISKLENDRIPPPAADTAVKLCQILGIRPEDLLALGGKLPSEVEQSVGSSSAAQEFLREAQEMRLSDDEWRKASGMLRRLRRR
jgi:transcriptional regulator with XRE-family HTH domain